MQGQAFNPYLPSWEYIPDGEPYVYGDRLYVFGSHDAFNGRDFCQNDYVLWSAPVSDVSNWRKEGLLYRTVQDPAAKKNSFMQAPDVVQGADGRFYLYYTLCLAPFMSIAVSHNLTGPYEYYGTVRLPNGHVLGSKKQDVFQFDPGVFRDDDGRYYLYTGFSPGSKGILGLFTRRFQMAGAYVMELKEDMRTVKGEPRLLIPGPDCAAGTGFEGHAFYEASSLRKIRGRYYFIYSSILSHELCYAVSDRPDGGFRFGGTLISLSDLGLEGRSKGVNYTGNTHGSLVELQGQWYVFYHRQTNRNLFSRQGCAEPLCIREDGSIRQAEVTSCGLNGKPLLGRGEYSAHIACHLTGKNGDTYMYGRFLHRQWRAHPYLTQTGEDREAHPDQYIANMSDGATAGFKYFDLQDLKRIAVEISGTGRGRMEVRTRPEGEVYCSIPLYAGEGRRWFEAACTLPEGVQGLYFTFAGEGCINFHRFELK